MKIIDLLNKIANEEELPKKVKYYDLTYEYNEYLIGINKYRGIEHIGIFLFDVVSNINDEVEVIEEDKKIDKKIDKIKILEYDELFVCPDLESLKNHVNKRYEEMRSKINEIIGKLNEKE